MNSDFIRRFERAQGGSMEELSRDEYLRRWTSEYGLENLYTKGADHLNTEARAVLHRCVIGSICEIGCGDGRIAEIFSEQRYLGVDINADAIKLARKRCPQHNFEVIGYGNKVPGADTFLFYTVLLHIPSSEIMSFLGRVLKSEPTRVIVGEPMLSWLRYFGQERNSHRDPHDYGMLFEKLGFGCIELFMVRSPFFPWFTSIMVFDKL